MNSQLYGKEYPIPTEILNYINASIVKYPTDTGVKRAKNLLLTKEITYSGLKRIKNYFDHYNPEINSGSEYALNGGDLMKNWIEKTLSSERDSVNRSEEIKSDVKADLKHGINATAEIMNRSETIQESIDEYSFNNDSPKENAITVLFNNDYKFLLLKRSLDSGWGAGQWGLVGGGIEEGELPEAAAKREIFEETNIIIPTLLKKTTINRDPNNIEHLFVGKVGLNDEITLNNEHTAFGYFTISEIKFLNTVPNLEDDIKSTITKN